MSYKKRLMLPFIVITGLITISCTDANGNSNKLQTDTTMKSFAVLELFTSEGCSSCPAADDLFATIQKEFSGQPVYLLAFHVDYWDRLGWKDIFSNADFTKRQSNYQRWLNTSSIYTPQVVVNGALEMVGSNEKALRNAISKSLSHEETTGLIIQSEAQKNELKIHYQVSHAPVNARFQVAVIQKAATSRIERGENKGRTLSHVQIVREWSGSNISSNGSGTVDVSLPADFNPAGWEVIVMIQDLKKGNISAVSTVHF